MIACHSRHSADCIDKAWQVSNSRVTGLGCDPRENSAGPITWRPLTLIGLGENTDKSEDMILRLQMGFLACFLLPLLNFTFPPPSFLFYLFSLVPASPSFLVIDNHGSIVFWSKNQCGLIAEQT